MFERPRLLHAGLIAAWSFIVIGVAWLRLSPLYDGWLVAGANVLLPADLWLEDADGPAARNLRQRLVEELIARISRDAMRGELPGP